MNPDRLRVDVVDVATGEVLGSRVIYDDYCLITAGKCELAHTTMHGNGTHVLTIKHAQPPSIQGERT